MVTSLPSVSVSLSLSLSLSLSFSLSTSASHAQHRKRGSASYIVREVHSVRARERDIEGDESDVTIVALKLAINFHVPFAKNSHNWR